MGFMDMVEKARENKSAGKDADFIAKDQQGEILVHSLTFFETDKGKWGALSGEIVKSSPKVSGAVVQQPGTKVKVVYKCHGDYPLIGYEGILRAVEAIYGTEGNKEETDLAMRTCFGSDETHFTKKATAKDREHPLFAGRGCLVGFSSKNAKNTDKRVAAGKDPIVEVSFKHIEQELEDIKARAAKLPEVEG